MWDISRSDKEFVRGTNKEKKEERRKKRRNTSGDSTSNESQDKRKDHRINTLCSGTYIGSCCNPYLSIPIQGRNSAVRGFFPARIFDRHKMVSHKRPGTVRAGTPFCRLHYCDSWRYPVRSSPGCRLGNISLRDCRYKDAKYPEANS